MTNEDTGSPCGDSQEVWADTASTRIWTIQPNDDGSFNVVRYETEGTFEARVQARTPGAGAMSEPDCDLRFETGSTGTFNGYIKFVVPADSGEVDFDKCYKSGAFLRLSAKDDDSSREARVAVGR